MVRIKHRYLLVNILYPADGRSTKPARDNLPDVVQFHAPTHNELTAQLLTRAIREQLGLIYGDYGAGVAGGPLASTSGGGRPFSARELTYCSQVSLACDLDIHSTMP